MRVLLTGGTGFIGAHLARRLLEGGYELTLVSHRRPPPLPEGPGVTILRRDLRDPTSLRGAGTGVDAVVSMAGLLRRPGVPDEAYWDVHYESTRRVLQECARCGIGHLLLVSTTGVYGETGRAPRGEEGPFAPGDVYETTKREAERYAMERCRDGSPALTVARPGLVYGPGDRHLLRLYRALQAGRFRVVGSGSNLMQPVYVEDLVDGLLRCLPPARPEGRAGAAPPPRAPRAINLAGAEPVSFRRFCETIASALGRGLPRHGVPRVLASAAGAAFEALHHLGGVAPPITRETVRFMTSDRVYDIGRARRELGWEPRVGLEEGVGRTVAWYRAEGLLA